MCCVMSHLRGFYLLSFMVTYSMSSVYYTLVLGDRPFPNLLFYQILLIRLYLRKHANNLVSYPQVTFTKFKGGFSCNFTNFHLNGLVFMKFTKLRSLYRENRKLDLHKTYLKRSNFFGK